MRALTAGVIRLTQPGTASLSHHTTTPGAVRLRVVSAARLLTHGARA